MLAQVIGTILFASSAVQLLMLAERCIWRDTSGLDTFFGIERCVWLAFLMLTTSISGFVLALMVLGGKA